MTPNSPAPAAMVLVPREPTQAMLAALGFKLTDGGESHLDRYLERYAAMIAAAPEPAEPVNEWREAVLDALANTGADCPTSWTPAQVIEHIVACRIAIENLPTEPAEPSVPADGPQVHSYDDSGDERTVTLRWPSGNFVCYDRTDMRTVDLLDAELAQARAEVERLRALYDKALDKWNAACAGEREAHERLFAAEADARALREEVAELNAACSRENRAWNDEAREHATLRERVADIAKRFRHAATFMLADSSQAHIACAEMLEREIAILSTPPSAPSGEALDARRWRELKALWADVLTARGLTSNPLKLMFARERGFTGGAMADGGVMIQQVERWMRDTWQKFDAAMAAIAASSGGKRS
jgi:hypothetical protein